MKNILQKWQAWVAIMIGLLTIITMVFDLPEKSRNALKPKPALLTFSGVVSDEDDNRPLKGVTIRLRQLERTTTSKNLGEFRFDAIETTRKTVDLTAQKDGYETYETTATVGNTAFNFTMKKTPNMLRGTVRDAESRTLLDNVTVRLPQLGQRAVTNSDGEYRFDSIQTAEKTVAVTADKAGYQTYTTTAMLGKTPFDFTMKPIKHTPTTRPSRSTAKQTLSGLIKDENGEPLAGVTVTLVEFDQTVTTTEVGKYEFQVSGARGQTVTLIAQKTGYETYDDYARLGNPEHGFAMKPNPDQETKP